MTKHREYGTTKEVVARLINHVGPKRASVLLGVGLSSVYGYCDPDSATQATFDQIRRLTLASNAPHAAEDLASLSGGAFMPTQCDTSNISDLGAAASSSHGDLIAALVASLADGVIKPREASSLLEKIDPLLRVLTTMRASLAQIARTPKEEPHE